MGLALLSALAFAQYTLTDDDVDVTGGVIQSCSYDFAITDIIIPDTQNGQAVIGIADAKTVHWIDYDYIEGVFEGKGITGLVLPSTIQFIGQRAFRTNEMKVLDLDKCQSLLSF